MIMGTPILVHKKASWYLDGPHDDNIRWHDVAMMVLNVGISMISYVDIVWGVSVTMSTGGNNYKKLKLDVPRHALKWLLQFLHSLEKRYRTNLWLDFIWCSDQVCCYCEHSELKTTCINVHLKGNFAILMKFSKMTAAEVVNTLRLRQNGRHFTDDIFKCILLNEDEWISTKISLKFVPKGPINNIPALVHIIAWRAMVIRQTIVWTNEGWFTEAYVSLSLNELND